MTLPASLLIAWAVTFVPQAQTVPPPPRPTPAPILIPGVNAPPTGLPERTRQDGSKPDTLPPGYLIGPQDQLKIVVFDEEGMTNTYPVDADGSITFPLINRIIAGGLTVSEFQDRLRATLANGWLRNPQVSVSIQQFKSQRIIVGGEVRTPGPVTMTGQMNLLEALAAAGSTLPSAGSDVTIARQRRNAAGSVTNPNDVNIYHVNLQDVLVGKAGRDLLLQDGDIINVPKAQTFTITGEVRNSGALIWMEGMTVEEAIARAGGLTDKGSSRRIEVTRLVDGKTKKLDLKLSDKVQPEDRITVLRKLF